MSACASCGTEHTGEYCPSCGERRLHAGDLSIKRTAGSLVESMTSLDARLWRSLRLLVTRPGFLTAELADGRRRAYLSPFQLFVLVNVLYFLVASWGVPVATFGTPLNVHVGSLLLEPREAILSADEGTLGWKGRMVRRQLRDNERQSLGGLELRFDLVVDQQAKAFMILFMPVFALIIALMRIGKREPGGLHVIFALHYLTFSLLLFVGVSFLLLMLRPFADGWLADDSPWIPAAVVALLTLYLTLAFRRTYHSRWSLALPQATVLAGSWVLLIDLYRDLLFVTTMWAV